MNYYEPKHAKPSPPFRETAGYKAVVLTAMTPVAAGLVATGGAAATYTLAAHHTPPGVYIGVAPADHADPNHVDPGAEFVHIPFAESGTTVATTGLILGPGY